MKLYIKLENGIPVGNPMYEQNILDAFGSIDKNIFVEFNRTPIPLNLPKGPYLIPVTTYTKNGDIYEDSWSVREMTDDEKLEKQNSVKKVWESQGYKSWVFDETICAFVPPVAYPNNGIEHRWDESTTSWIKITE